MTGAGIVPRATLRQRIRLGLVVLASWVLCRLPERPLLAVADLAGPVWYRISPERRQRARANLGRVCRWMAANGVGSARGRAAGRDPRALDDLVRDAFRHLVRYNLIIARSAVMDARYAARQVVIDDPRTLDEALADPKGTLFVGLHMGSMELPALYLSQLTGRPATVPTETLRDPLLQAHMVRTRQRLGLHAVELGEARRKMVAAIRRGDPVGIVGDRDLTGGGIEVPFFGAPAPLAAGPALLALETGVTPHAFGIHRDASGLYHAMVGRIPFPQDGTRRERVTAFLETEAQAFERFIAVAPEQWFAVFFPIWRDDPDRMVPAR